MLRDCRVRTTCHLHNTRTKQSKFLKYIMSQDGSASPSGFASPGEDVKPTVDQTKVTSHITLKFVSQNREDVPIKVKKSTPFEKMFVAYRNKFSLSEGDVRFVVEGERVKPFHTPKHHNLNDGDEVEAVLEMLGGC